MDIRLAGTEEESIVDGPGIRYTIFVQGCPHKCEGCHNPQTHSFDGGYITDTDSLYERIALDPLLDGVTFSGGEPFCQAAALACLAKRIKKELKLNIIVYTGYTFEYLLFHQLEKSIGELLEQTDILIDGRYVKTKRSLDLKFCGSTNQRIINCPISLRLGTPVRAEL